MRIIRFRHDRRTMPRLTAPPVAVLDPALVRRLAASGVERTLTFRQGREEKGRATAVDATTRFFHAGESPAVALVGLGTDTRMGPLIAWDVFHRAPVGGRLTVVEEPGGIHPFERRYYTPSLTLEGEETVAGMTVRTYRKSAPAAIAPDAGLDGWTFGIPCGPGDASALNACVGRILDLGVPRLEIILCGRPGANFLYRDRVRVIGEDLPPTPLRLGDKKNRLAEAASHGNLCLLHDRVILPLTFMAAVRAFGDDYPITGFQGLYFYDRANLTGQRYADIETLTWRPLGLFEALPGNAGTHAQPLVFGEERYQQAYGHAAVHTGEDYVIGSLYMAKRTVWRLCPQNAERGWMEWEDIEHGARASRLWGIPGRLNPHAFTQSLGSRFRTLGCQWAPGDGHIHEHLLRPTWPLLGPLLGRLRKPHIRLTEDAYRANLRLFARRHLPPEHREEAETAVATVRLDFHGRAALMHLLLARAQVHRTPPAVDAFIRDLFSLVVGEGAEPPYYWRGLRDELLNGTDPERLRRAVMRHWVIRGPMRYFPLRRMFGADPADVMALPHGPFLTVTTVLCALYLKLFRRGSVHFPGGVRALARAILASTPTPGLLRRGGGGP